MVARELPKAVYPRSYLNRDRGERRVEGGVPGSVCPNERMVGTLLHSVG